METPRFSPRQFMKARRPERFSDSVSEATPVLDRSLLEYHLDSLTSRNQETDFARFAKSLAEKEICPNLLPQTGPTGGGDSKVDSETYPVADTLAAAWYVGTGREASAERWAFAFSAKKVWRTKVQSDIKKIAETDRGYAKAFFITNQFVKDRERAEVEDQLRKQYGFDVRILDRSWILDRVFVGRHEALAIEELRLSVTRAPAVRKGPVDLAREKDLGEIETKIKEATEQGHLGFQFVDDCIEAASLARSLEVPRTAVDGRFIRAQRAAETHGTSHQRLLVAYQMAWTAYWWHEDYSLFAILYGAAETQAVGTTNAYELELLTNLWSILYALAKAGELGASEASLEKRTGTLETELDRLSRDQDRPSTALQARTMRLHMRLISALPDKVDPVLQQLHAVVDECEGLVGYPLEPLVEILTELGKYIGHRPAYGELFDKIVEVTAKRAGEVSAAKMLVKRGAQQLDADTPYEAIRSLGLALARLYRHESRDDFVRALYLCGAAYERVGLLWAARGTLVTAACVATNEFWTYSEVTRSQAACYNHLKWLELRLGRLPHALAWHEVDTIVKNVLVGQGYNPDRLAEGELEFDAILGILLLRTSLWDLKRLSLLPDALEKLGLVNAAVALQFALGHEDDLPESLIGEKADKEATRDFFRRWRDQPAADELPAGPLLYEQRTVSLTSNLLGCRMEVESENIAPCVELAESVLAALESLLSTGMVERIIARVPVLPIKIRKADFVEGPLVFETQDVDGMPQVEVRCAVFDPHKMPREVQNAIKDKLIALLSYILARAFMLNDLEHTLTKLFRDERALERAINFTSSFVTTGNVLGGMPKTTISDWHESGFRDYPVVRAEEWDAAERRAKAEPDRHIGKPGGTCATGEPPPQMSDMNRAKHDEMEMVSIIRESLWDNAGWSGTAFLWSEDDSRPPALMLVFTNAEVAGNIFRLWRKDLGTEDHEERLRVSIIRGISRKNPAHYRVILGLNPAAAHLRRETKQIIMMSRFHLMEPSSDFNLRTFLNSYEKFHTYALAYCILNGQGQEPTPVFDNYIVKHELHVRDAWQVGRHDPDVVGILEDDDVIIPPDQPSAPVVELLRWKRSGMQPHGE